MRPTLAVSFPAIEQAVHLHTTSLGNHAIPAFIRIILLTKLLLKPIIRSTFMDFETVRQSGYVLQNGLPIFVNWLKNKLERTNFLRAGWLVQVSRVKGNILDKSVTLTLHCMQYIILFQWLKM